MNELDQARRAATTSLTIEDIRVLRLHGVTRGQIEDMKQLRWSSDGTFGWTVSRGVDEPWHPTKRNHTRNQGPYGRTVLLNPPNETPETDPPEDRSTATDVA